MSQKLLESICSTIPAECWPASGETLVIGASGGPDSTALAFLLDRLNQVEQRGWCLHLAHLNHRLRGYNSDADARFVADLAESQGWQVTIEERPIKPIADRTKCTLEEAARNERYAFFERLLGDTQAHVIATAHHADDNAATILHRVIRGTGIRGLAGIPPVRDLRRGAPFRLIRPLLDTSRSNILAYLSDKRITFCHDHTNEMIDCTRNKIRNQLIPELESNYNPAACQALLRLGEQARWVNDYLQSVVDLKFEECSTGKPACCPSQEAVLDAAHLLRQPRIVQTEVVRRAITVVGASQKKLTFDHIVSILALAEKNVSGKYLQLPGNLRVAYDRKALRFSRKS